MTNQKKDKLIVEALGGCFHTNDMRKVRGKLIWYTCTKCGNQAFERNITLATPEGFFWWWPRMLTKEWADEFLAEDLLLASTPKFAYRKINPIVGRDKLVEFLERRNLGKTSRITT
jgi:hypothetical protein